MRDKFKIVKVVLIVILLFRIIPSSNAFASIIKQDSLSDGSAVYYVSTREENRLAFSMIEARMETKARVIYSGDMILNREDYFNEFTRYRYMPQNQVLNSQHGIGSYTGYVITTDADTSNNTLIANYRFSYFETKEQTQYVYDRIHEAIKANRTNINSDYDKAHWAYQWVLNNAHPDETISNFSAYHGLTENGTVCQGYATLYAMLANELGLDCEIVFGGVNGFSSNHAWNIVKLDDKWYCIDSTWGDTDNRDKYFLKTMDTFASLDYGYHTSILYDNYMNAGEIFATTDYDSTVGSKSHPIRPSVYNIEMDILNNNILQIGEGYTFMINNKDKVPISFKSENSNIAQVDDKGIITGMKEGIAIITAFNKELNVEQRCKITIVSNTHSPTLTAKNIKIKIGNKFNINVKDNDNGSEIKFVSSNPSVVKVNTNTGIILAIKKGRCKITCILTNGTSLYKLVCNVEVFSN